MTGYELPKKVFIHLDEIRGHIAEDNPNAADRVITEIFDGIRALAASPPQGHRRPNITSRPLRSKLAREYIIVNAPEKKPLWVVAVFHARRSPRVMAAILRGREEADGNGLSGD